VGVDAGADVNAEGGEYGYALQVASEDGHEKMVRMLLDAGADVNAEGGESMAMHCRPHQQMVVRRWCRYCWMPGRNIIWMEERSAWAGHSMYFVEMTDDRM
jgi:hypothetical protein